MKKNLLKIKALICATCITLFHSHGYTFFIDTWVLVDLAIKTPVAKAMGIASTHH